VEVVALSSSRVALIGERSAIGDLVLLAGTHGRWAFGAEGSRIAARPGDSVGVVVRVHRPR
jgi:hypothetical protein